MCGLTGWFDTAPPPGDAAMRLARMAAAIAHRGPDGDGCAVFAHAALAHRRLAIIDPAGGEQPMRSPDGRYTLAFNGEIYNHRDLRPRYTARGWTFRTDSDTEVLLAALCLDGPAGLARMRGMFALAFWDEHEGRGLLARDAFGIKPLFVHARGDALWFGSEAKAIRAGLDAPPGLDPAQLHLLMNFRYLPEDRSLFAGIDALAPGEVRHWHAGRTRSEFITPGFAPDADPIAALRDAVDAHLIADAPLGAYLSGGIDSAAVVAFAGRPLPCFTLEVGDDPAEADNATETARLLGVPQRRAALAFAPEQDFPVLIEHLEIPKINAIQPALTARIAVREVKVALSGLGGDELFLGYNAHRLFDRASRVPRPLAHGLGGLAGLWRMQSPTPWSEPERGLRALAAHGDWPRVYGLLRNLWDQPALRRRLYGPRLLDADLPDAFQVLDGLWPEAEAPIEAMRRFEWRRKMVNDLLWNEDRVSMAVGLEVRVPFVDARLQASVAPLSAAWLMPGGRAKGWLRDRLRRELPAPILARPKSGFQVDAADFFHTHLQGLAARYLAPERLRAEGLFNPAFVAELRALPPGKRHRWHYFMLYLMLLTGIWLERFTTTP